MSVSLQKGQKISLKKGDGSGLKNVMVGLGWDEAQQTARGLRALFAAKPQDIDCDASVILCGQNGKIISNNIKECLVYYGNLRHSSGAVQHQGDNLTGGGEGDDEQIMVDLTKLPASVTKLVFVVNIYDANMRNQHFGMIRNAFIRIVDMSTRTEICRFNLTEDYSGKQGMVVGEIYKNEGEWKFNAVGQGVTNASRVDKLVEMYK